jgi:hypothetical protein
MEAIEELKYKGLDIKIYPDDSDQSPDEWGDEGLFLVAYHRDFWVVRDKIATKDEVAEALKNVKDPLRKKYHLFGLEAYIHSGVALALVGEGNFPDRRWDVSYLGAVFVSKEEWKRKDKARKAAEGLIETWNTYLSGGVVGFKVEKNEEHIDSCWGYYDINDAINEAKSSVDSYIKTEMKKHSEKLKSYIKTGTPLIYRKPCLLFL